ncbi:NrsF family protein [Blastochloris sulfoviridis]|uniref:DUF1109 family protein n=1 Tax=Blastochloris sulfoviridis TaxID=50712 RepID=A0A5M6I2A1_9HYPH|nr:NrsF family protein [Blastochloris sulfoviridis]KAA5601989.1 DUF1109 family protein [Blastochloris sulfoviridis]
MRTDDLISALAADHAVEPGPRGLVAAAIAVGVAVAAVLFVVALGVRPDAVAALGTPRFPLKFVLTLALAVTATRLLLALARPGADPRRAARWLALPTILVFVALVAELLAVPADAWSARLVGRNAAVCLVAIPSLAIAPVAALFVALRRTAPTAPARTGAVAGLAAGALAATLYAAHCPDDSPLFVATWYGLSVALVTVAGAALGVRLLRW